MPHRQAPHRPDPGRRGPDRRTQVLDAAVRVLGSGGARALTHRAVDVQAGAPSGTTSNYFRSRAALVDGILGHLSELERVTLDSLDETPRSAEELVEICAAAFRQVLGPGRTLTLARQALMLEAAVRPELQQPLRARTQAWWDLLEGLLTAVGAPRPAQSARLLLAYVDGLLSDQLARPDADFDPVEALRPVVTALAQ